MSDPAPPSELVERVARAIGDALGLPFDTLYVDKREYINDRGSRHDVNAPHKADMLEAAQAAIAALPAAGAAMKLREALLSIDVACAESATHEEIQFIARKYLAASAPARDATPDTRLAELRHALDHFCKIPNHKRAEGFADWLDAEIARLSPPADQGEKT
jgi:hypothetical protein